MNGKPYPAYPTTGRCSTVSNNVPRKITFKMPKIGIVFEYCCPRSISCLKKSTIFHQHENNEITKTANFFPPQVAPGKLYNIAGWNITIFTRKYIFKGSMFHPATLVYQGVSLIRKNLGVSTTFFLRWLRLHTQEVDITCFGLMTVTKNPFVFSKTNAGW